MTAVGERCKTGKIEAETGGVADFAIVSHARSARASQTLYTLWDGEQIAVISEVAYAYRVLRLLRKRFKPGSDYE